MLRGSLDRSRLVVPMLAGIGLVLLVIAWQLVTISGQLSQLNGGMGRMALALYDLEAPEPATLTLAQTAPTPPVQDASIAPLLQSIADAGWAATNELTMLRIAVTGDAPAADAPSIATQLTEILCALERLGTGPVSVECA